MPSSHSLSRSLAMRVAIACAAVFFLGISIADARGGRGFSFGSRGGKTFTPPRSTGTAPRAVQPIQRSMTKPAATTGRPGAAAGAAGSRFGGGFGSMLMGGLIGAGLFGLLSGHGLFGGMTGLASMLGLLLQVGLIGGLIWLAMSFFRGRQPAMAGAQRAGADPQPMAAANPMADMQQRSGLGGTGGGRSSELAIAPADFEAFETLLAGMQDAFSREDLAGLRKISTPEMVSYLSEDIADNAKNGLRNELSGTRLLQGDLSEAWREADAEYATVAMRFELIDTMIERSTGKIVSGHPDVPSEATELWTFKRTLGAGADGWLLSAIQQTA